MNLESQIRRMPNGVVVLSVKGDAAGASGTIASELRKATAQSGPVMVVDLRELTSIDARGRDAVASVVTRGHQAARYLVMTPRAAHLRDSFHRMRSLNEARACVLI